MEKNLYKFIELLSYESGSIIKKYFRTNLNVEQKSDLSPVTIADKLAEEKMRELIQQEYPEHGIIGEEFGSINDDAEYKWILDPIDGTKSFISGVVSFGTLIALTKNNEPIIGCINNPILNELLIGDNSVSLLNNQKVIIKDNGNLNDATLLTTDIKNIKKYQNIDRFNSLIEQVKLFRTWGDCYGYYLLATGYADIMVDPKMSVWDLAALIPIIKGSGGIITDYYGNDPMKGNSTIAATPLLHKKVMDILNIE